MPPPARRAGDRGRVQANRSRQGGQCRVDPPARSRGRLKFPKEMRSISGGRHEVTAGIGDQAPLAPCLLVSLFPPEGAGENRIASDQEPGQRAQTRRSEDEPREEALTGRQKKGPQKKGPEKTGLEMTPQRRRAQRRKPPSKEEVGSPRLAKRRSSLPCSARAPPVTLRRRLPARARRTTTAGRRSDPSCRRCGGRRDRGRRSTSTPRASRGASGAARASGRRRRRRR